MKLLEMIDKLASDYLTWRTKRAMAASKSEEPELLGVNYSQDRGLEIMLAHPGVAILADECINFLTAYDAPNYVEMILQPRIDKGQRAILVTVMYQDGESPASKAIRLQKELDTLTEDLEDTRRASIRNGNLALRLYLERQKLRAEVASRKRRQEVASDNARRFARDLAIAEEEIDRLTLALKEVTK